MQLSAIDHVGVAVEDIDTALTVYRDTLGMTLVHRETVSEQGVDAVLQASTQRFGAGTTYTGRGDATHDGHGDV